MKKFFLLLGTGVLATTVAAAQNTGSSMGNSTEGQTNGNQTYQSETTQVLRGCLSGSTGNYTLTDQNGTQYTVNGDDAALRPQVGHEVQITTRNNQSAETSTENNGSSTRTTTNNVQVANVREVSPACNRGGNSGMNSNDTPETGPKLMAALQQQTAPGQPASPGQQATPPVTSQTPAAPASPTAGTNANSQVGTSPANNTGMTESQANHDAQAARQGELNSNPQTGENSGRGINNQGVNNPATTSPNAVPTSSNTATPAGNSNDQNKPLYERQATDIPWANQHAGNSGIPPAPH